MKWFARQSIKKNVLLFVLLSNVTYVYAQDSSAIPKILWQREYGCGEELSCSPCAGIFSKSDSRLILMGTSFRPKVYSEGKLWLWEIDQNGAMIKERVLSNTPEELGAFVGLGSRFVKDLALSNNGDISAIGVFDSQAVSLLETNREGKKLSTRSVSKNEDVKEGQGSIIISRKIDLNDGNLLLIGKDTRDDGMLIKTDQQGNRIWQKTYDLGKLEYFSDGSAIKNENGLLIVGCSTGTKDSFLDKDSYIWILRCDAQGNKLHDTVLSGNCLPTFMPRICQLESGNFVVTYDKNTDLNITDIRANILSSELNILGEEQVYKAEGRPPATFELVSIPNGGFVVATCTNYSDLTLYEHDDGGNLRSSISMNRTISFDNFSIVSTEHVAYIISSTFFENIGTNEDFSKVKIIAFEVTQHRHNE